MTFKQISWSLKHHYYRNKQEDLWSMIMKATSPAGRHGAHLYHICILGTENTDVVVTVVGFQVNSGSVGLSGLAVGARWTSHRSTHDVTLSALVGIFTLFCPIFHIAWIITTLTSSTRWVQLALSCIYITVCWILDTALWSATIRTHQEFPTVWYCDSRQRMFVLDSDSDIYPRSLINSTLRSHISAWTIVSSSLALLQGLLIIIIIITLSMLIWANSYSELGAEDLAG